MKTAKEFLKDSGRIIYSTQGHDHIGKGQLNLIHIRDVEELAIKFAKLHVEAALKNALEEVPYGGSDPVRYEDVKGILTCYPLSNIT